jgi:hypothetical protein
MRFEVCRGLVSTGAALDLCVPAYDVERAEAILSEVAGEDYTGAMWRPRNEGENWAARLPLADQQAADDWAELLTNAGHDITRDED